MKEAEIGTQQISVVIIDDEVNCIHSLEKLLEGDTRINIVATISDPCSAVEQIIRKRPDLLFLDIEMPGMTGIEILKALNDTSVKPFVIFITAFEKYTIDAIRAAAFDYLLKPVGRSELALAIERFITRFSQVKFEKNYTELLEAASKKKIRFNTTGGFIMVDPDEIIYIQADWNYSEIHFSKGKFEVVVINLGSLEDILPKGLFARISRSVIINLKYLDKVQRGKHLCILKKSNESFTFNIPVKRIRDLEQMI